MLNRAVIMGRLTADPELKSTTSGVNVCRFTVAVDRSYAKAGAERQTDFIDCVAWRQTGEFVSKYFTKGRMIAVEGRIQVGSYTTQSGEKRRTFEIVADNVSFCGDGRSSGSGESSYSAPAMPRGGMPTAFSQGSNSDFDNFIDDDDNDLPF